MHWSRINDATCQICWQNTQTHSLAVLHIYREFFLNWRINTRTNLSHFSATSRVYIASDVMHLYISATQIAIFFPEIYLFIYFHFFFISIVLYQLYYNFSLSYADSNRCIFWIRIYKLFRWWCCIHQDCEQIVCNSRSQVYKLYFLRFTSTFYLCMLSIYNSHSHFAICYLLSICTLWMCVFVCVRCVVCCDVDINATRHSNNEYDVLMPPPVYLHCFPCFIYIHCTYIDTQSAQTHRQIYIYPFSTRQILFIICLG